MRTRRSKVQIEQLRNQILCNLSDDHPQSVRHVFYRMTDPRLPEPVEKSDKGYRTVQSQLTNMRRDGCVPYNWITDATRRGYFVNTHEHPADALKATAQFYRRSIWADTPDYVEVWCESRSIAGVIESVTSEYAIPLYPAGGFASLTLAFQAAENIRHEAGDRPVHVIYIGDYDPAGVLIDVKIEDELCEHLPDYEITFHRIAITPEQISLMGLPTKPVKAGDKRGSFIGETVEAEAMQASVMRQLLRDKIESFIPKRAMAVMEAAEESERAILMGFADHLKEAM
ncbi:MAG: hypothetical protein HON65_14495 [Rhodospirillales bacterium]|jgi:hypothetical protein|nr:hypothetical protein [Rhodospirillales bacterium]